MYDVKDFTSRHRVRCRKHTQQPDPLISPTIAAKMPVAGESAIHHDIRLAGAIIRIQRASADTLGARGDSSIMHLLKLTLAIFAIFTPQPPPYSECSRYEPSRPCCGGVCTSSTCMMTHYAVSHAAAVVEIIIIYYVCTFEMGFWIWEHTQQFFT